MTVSQLSKSNNTTNKTTKFGWDLGGTTGSITQMKVDIEIGVVDIADTAVLTTAVEEAEDTMVTEDIVGAETSTMVVAEEVDEEDAKVS